MNLDHIPAYAPRQFVPEDAALDDVDTIVSLFGDLLERSVVSCDELEALLADYGELVCAVYELGSLLYVRMTCQTNDEERAEAYQEFVRTVEPALEPVIFEFEKRYMALREEYPDADGIYFVHDRAVRTDIELFREENIALFVEDKLDAQEYQTLVGKMTVDFMGDERTLPEMWKYLLEPDRGVREKAWIAQQDRRLQDGELIDEIFDRLVERRHEIALNAGFKNYIQYEFKKKRRFHYTPEDCIAFHDAIEKTFVPLVEKLQRSRAAALDVHPLRPWDLDADPHGLPPLAPFTTPDGLVKGCKRAFETLDPELSGMFDEIDRLGLLDLGSRKGKAPGGYQAMFSEVRKPFIFMNAVGTDNDVRTLLHEGGHAFHSLLCADQPATLYRYPPSEFGEVAAFGMEYLAGRDLSDFYTREEQRRAMRSFLESRVVLMPWVATIDAFQHWVYLNPKHSAGERRDAWVSIFRRFRGSQVDWSGLAEAEMNDWQRQLHLFTHPLYYIEYGIAQIGALQLWLHAKEDPQRALADYKKGLGLGGSKPLPELFEAAGLRFDFSEEFIVPLAAVIEEELF